MGQVQNSKVRLLGCVVKPLSQFFEQPSGHQFIQMPINCITQASKIITPTDTASVQLVRKVRCST